MSEVVSIVSKGTLIGEDASPSIIIGVSEIAIRRIQCSRFALLGGIDANIRIGLAPPSLRTESHTFPITKGQAKGSICASGYTLTISLSEEVAWTGQDTSIGGIISKVVEIRAVEVTNVQPR